ncbi:hypothetical protein TrVE_jg12282 [Triparma verrucosa]|uniref:Radical SAM core domain-containing protein n=2 Tax=Triparma TaxID=722752 RepID=A0A9W7BRD4_9STRA|nr:hypothetical protein TrVE_jg12282 [Triparma verrucosa]GMH92670.1 hypothetical protein TrST_g1786 [Triparma strigata]
MIYLATSPLPPGLIYHLGRSLYVSLTNTSVGLPLLLSRGPSFVMPESSNFSKLPDGYSPKPDQIVSAVNQLWTSDEFDDTGVTFAGAGDPLLELDTLISSANLLKSTNPSKSLTFRVNTNGLFLSPSSLASSLSSASITQVTVALNYATPSEYDSNMSPPEPTSFKTVCEFIEAFVEHDGIDKVTATCVDNGRVDVERVRSFAVDDLGVDEFKVRTYFG